MTQVVLLVMKNGKCAQHGEAKRALVGGSCGAEIRRDSEIVSEDVRLIVVRRPSASAFELLQRGNVWSLLFQYTADAPKIVPFVDTNTRMNVVGEECQLPGDHSSNGSPGTSGTVPGMALETLRRMGAPIEYINPNFCVEATLLFDSALPQLIEERTQ
jgi:hypothetical protein